MKLFFGTLAVACLFPTTTLCQGVLVLPQQAGDGNPVTGQSTSIITAISAPVISSTPPASSPGVLVLAQNAQADGAASKGPGSVATPALSQTSTSAPAAPGVVVLPNQMASQPASVSPVTASPVQSPTSLSSLQIPPSASNTLSNTILEPQTASATPSGFIVLAQPVTSNNASDSQSVGAEQTSTTIAQSLASSPSTFVSVISALTSISSGSDLPNNGSTSLASVLSATLLPPTSTSVQTTISALTSISFGGNLPNNGLISLATVPSATLLLPTSTPVQTTVSVQNTISAAINGYVSHSGSLAGTFISSSVGPPPSAVSPPPSLTASANNDDSSGPAPGLSSVQPTTPVAASVQPSIPVTVQAEEQEISQTTTAAAFAVSSIVLAQNAEPGNSTNSQETDCQNPGGVNGIDSSCWDILDMSNYTNTWWANNNAKCGGETANFSTCFWELHNLGTRDCTGVTPGACPEPDNSGLSAQDWYIAYNIYAINQVFTSLWTAIGNANTLAAETVGAIVALIDPPLKENLATDDILTAISASINIILPVGTLFQRHFIALTQQTPPVSKYLFPVGTTESQITQWESIQQELAIIVENYQSNVSQIIPTINNNEDIFVTFAESGAFSVNPLPNLSNESDKLLLGLNTFIISKAFQANNLIVGQGTDTDINQLVSNTSSQGGLAYDTGCDGNGYSSEGLCGPFYYDPTIGNTFSLDNLGDMRTNYTNQLDIVLGNWTTGDMLFGGAYRCQNDGGVQGSLATTVIQTNGNITLDCLSDLKVCEWNLASLGSDNEFTDCPTQAGYVVNGCRGCSEGSFDVNVPNAYLGMYLVNPNENDCVCNS